MERSRSKAARPVDVFGTPSNNRTIPMQIKRYDIVRKRKRHLTFHAAVEDFRLRYAGTAPASVLFDDCTSLYCLDERKQEVVFVVTRDSREELIEREPFLYHGQFQQADSVLTISYEQFFELARSIPLTPDAPVMFIYSVGRCGSTLLSNALKTINDVHCVSEPDVFTQLMASRQQYPKEQFRQLCDSALRFTLYRKDPYVRCYAIKFRNFVVQIADVLDQLYPQAKNVFVYRNMIEWARSYARAFRVFSFRTSVAMLALQHVWPNYVPLLRKMEPRWVLGYSNAEYLTILWLSVVTRYLKLVRSGISFLKIRYRDLKNHPQRTLKRLFAYTDIPLAEVDTCLAAFQKDSQQGTMLDRRALDRSKRLELTEKHIDEMLGLIKSNADSLKEEVVH